MYIVQQRHDYSELTGAIPGNTYLRICFNENLEHKCAIVLMYERMFSLYLVMEVQKVSRLILPNDSSDLRNNCFFPVLQHDWYASIFIRYLLLYWSTIVALSFGDQFTIGHSTEIMQIHLYSPDVMNSQIFAFRKYKFLVSAGLNFSKETPLFEMPQFLFVIRLSTWAVKH